VAAPRHKPLVRRALADADLLAAIDHCLAASSAAAEGFIRPLEAAYLHIRRHPGTGSPRYAHALDIPGLRFGPCGRDPYLVFCFEQPQPIEVWRVLHGGRDIPRWLREEP
jgi:toxin ParE1/3/4